METFEQVTEALESSLRVFEALSNYLGVLETRIHILEETSVIQGIRYDRLILRIKELERINQNGYKKLHNSDITHDGIWRSS